MHRIGYCRSHTSVQLHPTRRYPSTLALKTDSNTVADLVKHFLKMPLHTQALHSISRNFFESLLLLHIISSESNNNSLRADLSFLIQLVSTCAYSSDLHHSAQILQQPVLGRATSRVEDIHRQLVRKMVRTTHTDSNNTADPALQNIGLIEYSTAWDTVPKFRSTFSP